MDYPTYEGILFEKSKGIGRLTLNRPEKRNALRSTDMKDMRDCLERVQADSEVRVVIIRGAGKSFCSGHDQNEHVEFFYGTDFAVAHEPLAWERFVHMRQYLWGWWSLFWELPQLVISQVHGHALVAGMELALLADLCIMAEDAVFRFDPILNVGGKFTTLLPLLMGMRKAKEFFLAGATISGKEAAALGLVNRAVPPERLEEETEALAARIAALPIEFIHFNKLAVNKFYESMGVRDAVEDSINSHVMGTFFKARQEWTREVAEHGWRAGQEYLAKVLGEKP